MSRCLKERQLFALLDGSLGQRAEARLRAHLAGCAGCAERLSRLEQIRSALPGLLPVAEPNWDRIDRGIERAIVAVTEAPRPLFGWAPIGLAAAAAALVLLSLLLPAAPPGTPGAPGPEQAPAVAASSAAKRSFTDPASALDFVVLDVLGDANSLAAGQRCGVGEEIRTGADDGVRLGMGGEILVEVGGASQLTALALRTDDAALEVRLGDFLVSVPVGVLERELVVLGDSAVFTMLNGVVRFFIGEDGVTIHVYEGEVIADLGGGPTVLRAGSWQAVSAGERQGLAGSWEPLTITPLLTAMRDLDPGGDELEEREVERPTGTLPRRVIREAMTRSTPSLRSCYETALKRYPKIDVSVTSRVSVNARGQVTRVRIKGVERWPELSGCLSGVLGSMSFPPPSGGPVDLILPLRLSPRE